MEQKEEFVKISPYQFILKRIARCTYMPGSTISDKNIIKDAKECQQEYGRTPVREALLRLENEKFITVYPRKGMFVSEVGIKLINEVYKVRKIVEPAVLKEYGFEAKKADMDSWYKAFTVDMENNDITKMIRDDRDFHTYIISLSGNDIMQDLMDNILIHSQRIRILSYRINSRIPVSHDEHIQVIKLLANGEINAAADRLSAHIKASRELALTLY